ncbi:hypothetical protein B0H65DRAFT_510321 [Neurospora tetraspora]|uniref:DUF7779 domain-containing protein n=1 Tax=Neurospora tetraspora TaxID=94610 RepID=A0AAE0J9T7_9PEZI|nr:hypothetical protein B0H65DRAFT_510321 [Neurospora tetraspora]
MDASSSQRPDGFTRPNGRSDFEVAIICALRLEFDAVCLLIDKLWDEDGDQYGKVDGDPNIYTTGRMGKCNVVLVLLPNMGKASAASAAASLRSSYPRVSLALLVGICGAVPFAGPERDPIVLGNVIISNLVVQYDLGRALPDRFDRKDNPHDSLGRPDKIIRNILVKLDTNIDREHIEKRAGDFLKALQTKSEEIAKRKRRGRHTSYKYPGAANDLLFDACYRHKHAPGSGCRTCEDCHDNSDPACDESLRLSCKELKCDTNRLIRREHLDSASNDHNADSDSKGVFFFIGAIGSGDSVIRSGKHRDQIAKQAEVIAFEMEGAGVWDEVPCIVIKGVCDYADSHKNKGWQNYAAATAASVAKAVMERYIASARVDFSLQGMPISNNFVPRPSDITDIEKSLLPYHRKKQGRSVFVLHGLGGIGKTQLAVNFARQYKAVFSAIFWLDGTSEDSLKQSFANCAKRIPKGQIPENIRSPKTGDEVDLNDIVEQVQVWLKKGDNVDWLLIFDNVDLDHTQGEIPGAYDIRNYLPSDHGAVLITSRLSKLAQLGESKRIKRADPDLSKKIFEKWYGKELKLLRLLGGLPLALAQAAAYIGEADIPIAKYIDLYEKQWDELFENTDSGLLDYGTRSVMTTWMISFNAIETREKNAGNLLRLWAFLDNREMWHSLLQVARNDQEQWPKWLCDIACNEVKFLNIAKLLLRYSMIETRESEQSSYSMHPVVHRWISHIQDDAGKREFLWLAVMLIGFSVPHHTTKNYWVLQRRLFPHAERFLWWMGKLEGGECNMEDITMGQATHSLGNLYSDQGRLKEAETIRQGEGARTGSYVDSRYS